MTPQDTSTTNKNNYEDNVQKTKDKSDDCNEIILTKRIGTDYSYKHQIVWKNAIGFLFLHLMALWGLGIIFTGGITFKTFLWFVLLLFISTEGVTIGAHRLVAHKTFKASPLLKVILLFGQTMAGQNSVFIWSRDHRLHHRYSDTDGDPHNSKRGFFFCHMGWLMMKKHPYVLNLGMRIDMSDLLADPIVMFQKKYYYYLYFLIAVFIPVFVPCYYFGETLRTSLLTCYFARYMTQLNGTWLVNSAAHLYGTRPYDKKLQPVESWFVSFISLGEGWHNYHHAFPWDYKAAELSMHFNQSASFIRFFEKIGLAYDLKTASPEMVRRRVIKTGDGTHYEMGNDKDRNAVTAIGILHPLNPSYNVVYSAPEAVLEDKGLPLNDENDVFDPRVANRKTATA
ncbi:acyl-CoA Delta-9 desaturase-like isoform X1 [Maniola jurtina]|uniref:acyl-CoA Delta-9 desaturase-like isoform X1 n=1 Tax=Maniola jurtina TaxID=191418 RepID=UPI001E6864BB|nr:acyl-CoA Delta-9 desaturase-like isoform X1 [Maniola jurtina]XP_045767208.1 acyl-CoA Delta-9 desaturase-like isoform X1 [Maniola jurtina]